ncbi:hypothetical protein [Endozoicomonas sp. ALB115]|uniref:hypothetical protein n=1 Tax=Endozoicomonas sp. ALB115 TaxID=3403074 RepID=UPI003BB7C802
MKIKSAIAAIAMVASFTANASTYRIESKVDKFEETSSHTLKIDGYSLYFRCSGDGSHYVSAFGNKIGSDSIKIKIDGELVFDEYEKTYDYGGVASFHLWQEDFDALLNKIASGNQMMTKVNFGSVHEYNLKGSAAAIKKFKSKCKH